MPYEVIQPHKGVYQLINLKNKQIVKKNFTTPESAINAGLNYMNYRGEKGVVIGNNEHLLIVREEDVKKKKRKK